MACDNAQYAAPGEGQRSSIRHHLYYCDMKEIGIMFRGTITIPIQSIT